MGKCCLGRVARHLPLSTAPGRGRPFPQVLRAPWAYRLGAASVSVMNQQFELPTILRARETHWRDLRQGRSDGRVERVRRGFYVTVSRDRPAWEVARDRELAAIAAAAAALSCAYAFSHTTAARLLGLSTGPWDGVVHITTRRRHGSTARAGVQRHFSADPPTEFGAVGGLTTTIAEPRSERVLRCPNRCGGTRAAPRGGVGAARQPVTLRVVGARAAPRGGRMPRSLGPRMTTTLRGCTSTTLPARRGRRLTTGAPVSISVVQAAP